MGIPGTIVDKPWKLTAFEPKVMKVWFLDDFPDFKWLGDFQVPAVHWIQGFPDSGNEKKHGQLFFEKKHPKPAWNKGIFFWGEEIPLTKAQFGASGNPLKPFDFWR